MIILATLLALLLACPPKMPPAVFGDDPPAMVLPDLSELPAVQVDDCAAAIPILPSTSVLPGCRGVLVPPRRLAEMMRAEDLAEFWERRAATCAEYRDKDRRYCEQLAGDRWVWGEETRRALNWQRTATPAAFVGGVLIGGAIAVGIVRATP